VTEGKRMTRREWRIGEEEREEVTRKRGKENDKVKESDEENGVKEGER
jgi:hypothetical protein